VLIQAIARVIRLVQRQRFWLFWSIYRGCADGIRHPQEISIREILLSARRRALILTISGLVTAPWKNRVNKNCRSCTRTLVVIFWYRCQNRVTVKPWELALAVKSKYWWSANHVNLEKRWWFLCGRCSAVLFVAMKRALQSAGIFEGCVRLTTTCLI